MERLFEKLIKNAIPELATAELQCISESCIFKKLRKKEQVLREGEVSRHKIFVISGLLRNFSIGAMGAEHIVRFTDSGNWTIDPESYFSGLPSKYNIDAIETTEIAMVSHPVFEKLVQNIQPLRTYFNRMMTVNMGLVQQRVLDAISASAEEKYIGFTKDYPAVFNRVPLHMVASYLGVSRETLTRVRQGIAVSTHGKTELV